MYFPKEVWDRIYEYDATYHDQWRLVIRDLQRRNTRDWIVWNPCIMK